MKNGMTMTATPTNPMGLKKKTIRAVNEVLHDPEKRKLYSEDELVYMEKQIKLIEKWRSAEKKRRKAQNGFGYDEPQSIDDC